MGRRKKSKVTNQKIKKKPAESTTAVKSKPKAKVKIKKDTVYRRQKQDAINAYMRKYKENKLSNSLYPVDYRMLGNVTEKERILQAHWELKTGKVKSIAEASRKWCVHYDKLQRRASGKVAWDKGKGPRPILNDQEEAYLVSWITKKCLRGTPATPVKLIKKASKLMQKNNKISAMVTKGAGKLQRWHKSFLNRHPQIVKISKKDLHKKYAVDRLKLDRKHKRGRAYLIIADALCEDSIISDELLEAVDIAVSAEVEISDAQFQDVIDDGEIPMVDNSHHSVQKVKHRKGVREMQRGLSGSETESDGGDDSDDSDSDNDSDSSSSEGEDSSDEGDSTQKKEPVKIMVTVQEETASETKKDEEKEEDEVVACMLCKGVYGVDDEVWVGCDVCQNWMHVGCLPVLVQKETQQPESFWCCPKCSDWVHLAE